MSISIRFLGTGGARFVVAKQIRASGGMWMRFGETQVHVDPGAGCTFGNNGLIWTSPDGATPERSA